MGGIVLVDGIRVPSWLRTDLSCISEALVNRGLLDGEGVASYSVRSSLSSSSDNNSTGRFWPVVTVSMPVL